MLNMQYAEWDVRRCGRARARLGTLVVAACGLTAGVAHGQAGWVEEAIVRSDAPGALESFGISVDCEGDTAVVGCWGDTVAGDANAGSVFVFARGSAGWALEVRLVAPDHAPDDRFGWRVSVSADGRQVLVGVPNADVAGLADAGAAYLFERAGGTGAFVLRQKLIASDRAAGDSFGSAVHAGGPRVLVGAYEDDHSGFTDAGSVYPFEPSGGSWVQRAKLLPADPQTNGNFGITLAAESSLAVVGASKMTSGGQPLAGAAYLFRRSGSSWSQETKLVAPVPDDFAYFGSGCDVSGERVVVGADAEDNTIGRAAGAAYVFENISGTWTLTGTLAGLDQAAGDRLGLAAEINGDTVVVGAPLHSAMGISEAGAVYQFGRAERGGAITWTQTRKLVASDAQAGGWFGYALGFREGVIGVGAPFHDFSGLTSAGQAYVFRLCSADFNGDGTVDSDDFFDFLNAFHAGLPGADVNGDGSVDADDFFDFLNLYLTGC